MSSRASAGRAAPTPPSRAPFPARRAARSYVLDAQGPALCLLLLLASAFTALSLSSPPGPSLFTTSPGHCLLPRSAAAASSSFSSAAARLPPARLCPLVLRWRGAPLPPSWGAQRCAASSRRAPGKQRVCATRLNPVPPPHTARLASNRSARRASAALLGRNNAVPPPATGCPPGKHSSAAPLQGVAGSTTWGGSQDQLEDLP